MRNMLNNLKGLINESTKSIKGFSKKKKIILSTVSGLLLIITIGTFSYARNTYGFSMTNIQKENKINQILSTKDYDKATEIANKYYSNDSDKRNIFVKIINLCRETKTGSLDEANQYIQQELKNMPKIVDINFKPTYSFSYDYVDVILTVKNEGNKDINYVKINLFFLDGSGNIIYSDWTNDNSIIKQGSTQIIKHMVKWNTNWKDVKTEVEDWKFR